MPLDQYVLILFVNDIYIGKTRTVWHRKLCMKTCYISKSLPDFFDPKFFNILYTIDTSRSKCNIFFVNNIYIGNIGTV